ncbi:MAG: T9SS type A sorting domain-containing protein [Bacteroidales bacterium]|nr:T9SS type A sorting domain-containing protein [Bacteroidales bacterium]
MKKTTLFLSLLFIVFGLFAQKSWVGFTSDSPALPQIQIVEQNNSQLILDISISGMYVSEVTENGQTFQRLELIPDRSTKEIGRPELPMITELIGVPDNRLVSVEILEMETIKQENYVIYPFQTPTTDNPGGHAHEFVMDKPFYLQSKSFPGRQVYIDNTGIWRDVKVASLHLVPFEYNASDKGLEVATNIKVKISFTGNDPTMNLNRSKSVSPKFYRMYESKILNFSSLGYTKSFKANSDIKYLVITNTGAVSSVQPFIDWKNQQGQKVEVKTLESGFEDPQDFKTYIESIYNSDNLEYILIVGDAYPNGGSGGGPDIVPMYWWAPSGEDATYSDSWYTCLDGPDDHYADIAIGRIVYDNLAELELQIQKTMDHYLAPDMNSNWAENSILIAHQENYPGKYTQCCEEIRTFPYALQTPIFEQAYGGAGYTNSQVVDYVNANSCGIFNYRGHGSATELWQWGPSGSFTAQHVNQLTNDDQLFVFFDVCCDNMDIVAHAGDCLCESFMKSPVASVAANGAIIPSYTIPNHDYDKEMYKAVFNEGIFNIGYVTNYANVTVLNVHGTIGRSNVRTYLWLGDASIEPWTLQPANLSVIHDDQLFLGLSTYSVTVTGTGGALENALVCLTNADQTLYGVAYTDASGVAEITFDEPVQIPGDATLTVTYHNHIPYQANIAVIPQSGPYVIKESYTLDDQTGGNGDGLMDYGESVELSLSIKNVGITAATNVSVTLSSADPYITFTDDTEIYGDIDPEEILEIANGFAFDVADDIPDGHYVIVDVEASGDGDEIWNSSFTMAGHAPVLTLGVFEISDPTGNGNGKIDPGETVDITISVENTGSSEAFSVLGDLSAIDPFLTINTVQITYGNIGGAAFAEGTFSVTASPTTPTGQLVELTLDISADMGITGMGSFDVVIGQIPVLLLDLDGNANSATAMQATLADMDISCELLTSFPADLNIYSSVFVCLGIYSDNHVLSNTEGQALADYLNTGGNLYMEGGDTWYYDSPTPVHAMFNINGTSDGSSDMGTVLGQAGTFTEGMTFNYTGDNSWMDHIDPISPAYTIFQNQSPSYGTGIAYDEGTYKTIGASHEFGGLADGTSPSTKADLMAAYMDFFDMSVSFQAIFTSNVTELCTQEIVEFYDMSTGGAISWQWTFEGGSPGTSTNQNPMVAYFNAGTFDVTLEISDGVETSTLTLPDYITVLATPGQASAPEGEDIACTNYGVTYDYTTIGAAAATSYIWTLEPAEAGTISGDGTTGTVTWTENWAGDAVISVQGVNDCGEGLTSDGMDVMCTICTGIDEATLSSGVNIFPNPSDGQFTLKFGFGFGTTDIKVMNTLNEVLVDTQIYSNRGEVYGVDLSDLAAGIYYIRIAAGGSEIIRKVIVK